MKRWTIVWAWCVSACAATPAAHQKEAPMTVKAAIVEGTAHSGDPATVYLGYAEGALCTGSLIAPRAVLTARHCVETAEGTPMEPTHVGTGTTSAGGRTYANVTAVRKIDGGTWADQDIAVLILDREGDLTPYAWGGAVAVGDGVVGVGFGQTDLDAGDSGTKRRGESSVASVSGNVFTTTGSLGCYGDSGGPAFVDGRVVGVAANISTEMCSSSVTNYMRVEAFRAFIEGAIAESEGALPDGTDPGDGSDPAPPPGGDPAPPPGGSSDGACMDTCPWAFDGECDDGGPGSLYAVCALGTDCGDCGPRSGGSTSPDGPADDGSGWSGGTCIDTCTWAFDGECDDGGPGSLYAVCPLGSDCADCGPR
jgi:hypothetical protein